MTVYMEAGGMNYSVNGKYHENIKLFSVELLSKYEFGRFPGEERRQFTTTLTSDQLTKLIEGLQKVLKNQPKAELL